MDFLSFVPTYITKWELTSGCSVYFSNDAKIKLHHYKPAGCSWLTYCRYDRPNKIESTWEVPQRPGLLWAHPRSSCLLIMAQQRFQVFKTNVMFLPEFPGPLFPQLMGLQLRRPLQGRKDQSADQHVESNKQKEQVELSGVSARLQGRAAAGDTFLHPLVE